MYSVANKPEQCFDCHDNNNNINNGWFICQECQQLFCSRHSIFHRHRQSNQEQISTEKPNPYTDSDARMGSEDAKSHCLLISPSTPITPTSPLTTLVNQLQYPPLIRLLTYSSNSRKQSFTIDKYELLSDETLDELIGDNCLTMPPNEIILRGRISFASQYPYMNGKHHLRLSINRFDVPSSWAFVGIISEGLRLENNPNSNYINRSSYGWHIGRQSIIYDRHVSTSHNYDGRHVQQGDILTILIDCNQNTIEMKNERTSYTHGININTNYCPLPWLFAVNFNYKNHDLIHLLD